MIPAAYFTQCHATVTIECHRHSKELATALQTLCVCATNSVRRKSYVCLHHRLTTAQRQGLLGFSNQSRTSTDTGWTYCQLHYSPSVNRNHRCSTCCSTSAQYTVRSAADLTRPCRVGCDQLSGRLSRATTRAGLTIYRLYSFEYLCCRLHAAARLSKDTVSLKLVTTVHYGRNVE